jgi:hypothetical protein
VRPADRPLVEVAGWQAKPPPHCQTLRPPAKLNDILKRYITM